MMKFSRNALLGAMALGGLVLGAGNASALPMPDPAIAAQTQAQPAIGVEKTRWVCGPYRCFWRPGYGYYGPRRFYGPRPWGWRHRWHGGWHHGWHRGWHRW